MNTCPLVRLKDILLTKINTRDVGEIEVVLIVLDTVKPIWIANQYHYKGKEIATWAKDTLVMWRSETTHWKRRRKLDTLITKAEGLAEEFWRAECEWKQGKVA